MIRCKKGFLCFVKNYRTISHNYFENDQEQEIQKKTLLVVSGN